MLDSFSRLHALFFFWFVLFCHPLSSQMGKGSLTVQTHLNLTFSRDKDDSGRGRKATRFGWGSAATVVPCAAADWGKRNRKRISRGVYFSSQQKRPSLMVFLDTLPFCRHGAVLTWPFLSVFLPLLSHPGAGGGACKVSSHTLRYKNNPGFIGIAMGGWWRGWGGWGLSVIQHNSPLLLEWTALLYTVLTAPHTHTHTHTCTGRQRSYWKWWFLGDRAQR